MIFEQAFYTRETDKGLSVVASSNPSIGFKEKCLNVGSKFEVEPTSETAEFVYYSEAFGCYVGVGVSPASFSDVAGKNKLVHIWVPKEKTNNPNEYYIKYYFDRTIDKNKNYYSKEFPSVFSQNDYSKILRKYGFNETRLASLFKMLMPLLFRERNFLAIAVSPEKYIEEEFPVIARELTWLMSQLIPALEDDKVKLSKNLSYSVLSTTNVSVVNIAYVKDATKYDNVYVLDNYDISDVPEFFKIIASKAISSYEEYQEFLKVLYSCRIDKGIDSEKFELMVFYWKMKSGGLTIKKKDLPISFTTILKRAQNTKKYREFLYQLCKCVEGISDRDLALLHKNIFIQDQITYEVSGYSDFTEAYEIAANTAFFTGNSRLYNSYMNISNEALKALIYKAMWDRQWESEGRENCIQADIDNIIDVRSLLDRIHYYNLLIENTFFLGKIRGIALNKDIYFQANLEDRIFISKYLKGTSEDDEEVWKTLIREKIAGFFVVDETYLDFVTNEIGKIENDYAGLYFSNLVTKCNCAEEMKLRLRLQEVTHRFLEKYEQLVMEDDLNAFNKLDLTWYRNDLRKHLKNKSIEELASFNAFGDYLKVYPKDAWIVWLDFVYAELNTIKCSDSVIDLLAGRINELPEELISEYLDSIWNYYYESVRLKMGLETCSLEERLPFAELLIFDPRKPYFRKYDKLLLSDWCEAILMSIASVNPYDENGNPCDNYLSALVGRTKDIPTDYSKRYKDAVWDFCGSNLNWRMFCSVNYGVKNYSIWDGKVFNICDTDCYCYIFQLTATGKHSFRSVVDTVLLNTGAIDAEFNRCCYLLWEEVKKNRQLDLTKLNRIGDLSQFRGELLNFLTALQDDIFKLSGDAASINFLLIEVMKDQSWAGKEKSSTKQRCQTYRCLKEQHESFYDNLIHTSERPWDSQVSARLKEIRIFEKLDSREPVDENNLEKMVKLLSDAEALLGMQVDLVIKLSEECECSMNEIMEKQETLRDSLNQDIEEKNKNEAEIRKLERKNNELDKNINSKSRELESLKSKTNRIIAIRQGKQNPESLKRSSQKDFKSTGYSTEANINLQNNHNVPNTNNIASEGINCSKGNGIGSIDVLKLTGNAADF